MYAFWRQRPQQLQRVALQYVAIHSPATSLTVIAPARSAADTPAGAVREQLVKGQLRLLELLVCHELVVVALS